MSATHEVTNQVPPLVDYDVSDNPTPLEGLRREGAERAEDEVRELGALAAPPARPSGVADALPGSRPGRGLRDVAPGVNEVPPDPPSP
ncbi:hypothetical protein QFW96_03345 [Saccharopolyspora sp. TS4A08]|uniref:Uncharacterized protein n=1 Tax=Saccharopolyspora ipomoeae TaxID=3042027 RepID=A0ABT6PI12_9PSEU|nr:hypothetical protein [Saccharopolyspora sp. TS4A08]MDI2027627.1 hypothetical protein [Saccharopolyspora sp. TS4A08]